MDRFYLFDVYGSPWFSAIYILLFISLIGCVVPRTWHYAKDALSKPAPAPSGLTQLESYQEVSGNLEAAESWLKGNKFRITKDENGISAEKGYLRETGNLVFHLALIVILLGVGASSVFGMRGEAIVTVGERFINVPTSYDNLAPGRFFDVANMPAFAITAANFEAKYDPETRQPLDYKLTVLVSNSVKEEAMQEIVRVNEPLTFGDSRVYLQANGFSPLVTVRDKNEVIKFEGPVPFLPQDANLTSIGAIKVPDMNPQIGFVSSFFPTAARDEVRGGFSSYPALWDPRLLVSVWQGDLKMDSGVPQSVYRIDTSEMTRIGLWGLSIGESYSFGNPDSVGTITFNGVVPWVNLQVVKDPGKPWALAGSIVAITSLMASLFIRQRRIYVKSNGGRLEVAGLALNRLPGLDEEIKKMLKEVSK
jgi:cytochrome c biogenesis protein